MTGSNGRQRRNLNSLRGMPEVPKPGDAQSSMQQVHFRLSQALGERERIENQLRNLKQKEAQLLDEHRANAAKIQKLRRRAGTEDESSSGSSPSSSRESTSRPGWNEVTLQY